MIMTGETEVLGEKSVPLPLCRPQVPQGLFLDRNSQVKIACSYNTPPPLHNYEMALNYAWGHLELSYLTTQIKSTPRRNI
jgi:hypothetical protein